MKKLQSNFYLQEIIISVILIVHNNENKIENIIRKTNQILSGLYPNYEIIIVDNNSYDNTLDKINALFEEISNIRVIRLSRTCSIDIAYTAGLDNCIGDYSVIIDPRMASLKLIPLFVEKLLQGFNIVYLQHKENFTSKWSARRSILLILEKLSNNKFTYQPAHMFAFNRKVINIFTSMRRKSRNFIYISNALGFSHATVLDTSMKLKNKETYEPHFFEFLFIVSDIIISNSFKPMRFLAIIGLLVNLLLLLYVLSAAIAGLFFNIYFISKDFLGPFFIIVLLFFLLFFLLMVMSEYIIRILDETRNEPIYFISDEIDKSIISVSKKRLNIYRKS
jgi:glycosyltransferase involved in cell wall biosynthesis